MSQPNLWFAHAEVESAAAAASRRGNDLLAVRYAQHAACYQTGQKAAGWPTTAEARQEPKKDAEDLDAKRRVVLDKALCKGQVKIDAPEPDGAVVRKAVEKRRSHMQRSALSQELPADMAERGWLTLLLDMDIAPACRWSRCGRSLAADGSTVWLYDSGDEPGKEALLPLFATAAAAMRWWAWHRVSTGPAVDAPAADAAPAGTVTPAAPTAEVAMPRHAGELEALQNRFARVPAEYLQAALEAHGGDVTRVVQHMHGDPRMRRAVTWKTQAEAKAEAKEVEKKALDKSCAAVATAAFAMANYGTGRCQVHAFTGPQGMRSCGYGAGRSHTPEPEGLHSRRASRPSSGRPWSIEAPEMGAKVDAAASEAAAEAVPSRPEAEGVMRRRTRSPWSTTGADAAPSVFVPLRSAAAVAQGILDADMYADPRPLAFRSGSRKSPVAHLLVGHRA